MKTTKEKVKISYNLNTRTKTLEIYVDDCIAWELSDVREKDVDNLLDKVLAEHNIEWDETDECYYYLGEEE